MLNQTPVQIAWVTRDLDATEKALTTLLLARLVDRQKLTWDTPVTRLMPSFKLGDEATTSSVLVKHLICACTGLPRHIFRFFYYIRYIEGC